MDCKRTVFIVLPPSAVIVSGLRAAIDKAKINESSIHIHTFLGHPSPSIMVSGGYLNGAGFASLEPGASACSLTFAVTVVQPALRSAVRKAWLSICRLKRRQR